MVDLRVAHDRPVPSEQRGLPAGAADDGEWRSRAAGVILAQLGDPTIRYVVAEASGVVVGWGRAAVLQAVPGPGFPTGVMGNIQSLVVAPAHRGTGLGTRIATDLNSWLFEEGAEVVDLLATPHAEAIYRRLGYEQTHHVALRRELAP